MTIAKVDMVSTKGLITDQLSRLAKVRSLKDLKGVGVDLDHMPAVKRFRNVLTLREKGAISSLPSTVVIGDIHNSERRLNDLLRSRPVKQARRLIFLGDYFDRDVGSRGVFDRLRSISGKETVFLLGNHEWIFLLAMQGSRRQYDFWLINGGYTTLSAAMDTGQLIDTIRVVGQESGAEGIKDLIDKNEVFDFNSTFVGIRSNPFLRQIRDWIITNNRLYHTDEYGMLYIHAGIEGKGIGTLPRLDVAYQAFIANLNRTGKLVNDGFDCGFGSCLWMRYDDWLESLEYSGKKSGREFLADLGVRGVVFGHQIHTSGVRLFDRFFGIDTGMADYCHGRGGMLEISPKGINLFIYPDRRSKRLEKIRILKEREFKTMLREDAELLADKYRDYFKQELEKFSDPKNWSF